MSDPEIYVPVAKAIPVAPPSNPAYVEKADNRSSPVFLSEGANINDELAIKKLAQQGYTKGLAEALLRTKSTFQLSIWIVDNSGSMQNLDGHRIVQKGNLLKLAPCTRWAEMQQTVEYHALLAAELQSSTVFRLLNDPGRGTGEKQFAIAQRGHSYINEDIAIAKKTIENTSPGGVTPLTAHLNEVRNNLIALEPQLRENGTKVAIVVATDGLPTNSRGVSDSHVRRKFSDAVKAMEGLPVWIVVRLCTDEEKVVEYWNSLDTQLELSLEVIDDYVSEAGEIQKHNPWINYGLPLHRMREMGFHHRLFDLLDERQLSKYELMDFCRMMFGDESIPDPEEDWKKFYNYVQKLVHKEQKTWNPVSKQLEPWIDLGRLKKDYGEGGSWFFSK